MEGVQDRLSTTESAQVSCGYDGPGPCGVLPPHRTRLGGQSCLSSSSAGRVHSTPDTRAGSEHEQSGSTSGSSNSRVGDSPAHHADRTPTHPRLSITVTLPACRTDTEGRGPPFPVIIFMNGFQVCLDRHEGRMLGARAREMLLDSTAIYKPVLAG